MAKTISGAELRASSSPLEHSLRGVWTLRLILGFIVLLGATCFFLGTSWDIQWHSFIGRDRTLIPPHQFMLLGVALGGVAALVAVLVETLWARQNSTVAQNSTSFADAFHGSLGAYIAGFGALDAAIGFPLDSYWHALYGIDVAIWAPFHIMFAVGMAIVALGSAYMLIAAAHLAEQQNALKARRVGYIGAAAALAITLSIFTFLLFDAYGGMGTLDLGIFSVNVFTVLAALLGTWILVTATYALPWRWAATSVTAISLLFVAIVALYVPPATDFLLGVEHLAYRRPGFHPPLVAFDWPLFFLVSAIIIDCVMRTARRRNWSPRKLTLIIIASSLIGFLPMPLTLPIYPAFLAVEIGIAGSIVSLLLGLVGAYVGTWLGRNMGESMHSLER